MYIDILTHKHSSGEPTVKKEVLTAHYQHHQHRFSCRVFLYFLDFLFYFRMQKIVKKTVCLPTTIPTQHYYYMYHFD